MRKDIQGLRSIAVIAVLLFHFWPNRVPGGYLGVDIFFVISGFLITSHLIKKPPSNLKGLLSFWAKRIRRLLPLATVVLITTLIASIIWVPQILLSATANESIASALYLENWKLANKSTNYFEPGNIISPIQHFWSLSVEEQFYILWPLLITLSFFIIRKIGKLKIVSLSTIGLVFIISLYFSITLTKSEPARAYFITTTRIWELALGGIVAIIVYKELAPSILMSRLSSWIGLTAIAISMFIFDTNTAIPGYLALVPTVGAALLLYADIDSVSLTPKYFLSMKPNQIIGDLSYSIYLWHWPVLIIAPFFLNSDLTFTSKSLLIIFIFALSLVTKRYIEDPFRKSKYLNKKNIRTFVFGACCIISVATLSANILNWNNDFLKKEGKRLSEISTQKSDCFGAEAIRNNECEIQGKELVMTPAFATTDKNQLDRDGCYSYPPYDSKPICSYGKKSSNTKVALLGNSHAGMLFSPILKTANENGWKLDTFSILLCYNINMKLAFPTNEGNESENCLDWNDWALETISNTDYDLVIISNSTGIPIIGVSEDDKYTVAQREYKATIQRLIDSNKTVLVVRDTPDGINYAPDCITNNLNNVSDCNNPRNEALKPDPLFKAALEFNSNKVYTLDLSNRFCDETTCYVTMGGIIMYWDQKHMTDTFSKTLYPEISESLLSILSN